MDKRGNGFALGILVKINARKGIQIFNICSGHFPRCCINPSLPGDANSSPVLLSGAFLIMMFFCLSATDIRRYFSAGAALKTGGASFCRAEEESLYIVQRKTDTVHISSSQEFALDFDGGPVSGALVRLPQFQHEAGVEEYAEGLGLLHNGQSGAEHGRKATGTASAALKRQGRVK